MKNYIKFLILSIIKQFIHFSNLFFSPIILFQSKRLGNSDKDIHPENIKLVSLTLIRDHLEIFGNEHKDEQ